MEKEVLISEFWNHVQGKIENGLSLFEALDQTVNEQSDLWEILKKSIVRR